MKEESNNLERIYAKYSTGKQWCFEGKKHLYQQ